ncbi:hypothetical protein GO013_08575 [Pseudodesulfovibrio sp. JC047]|uniref:hypothetical protein n=1 Tax=Pseudodesulfovibrio sp. JC047 TaxID=2683199 RepID=UPI0013D4973E|nr:hypothetical protein [Pseudodesulfovibrio sp. JC047]NDV19470.1 hypothetical protein [Pseudodesulfovibrio sp. JC047]
MFPGTTMLDYIFWMVMGALQVLVVMGLVAWLKHYGRKVIWWQVGLFYLGFASLCGVIAGGTTLMGEYESIAGWYFIGVLGLPVVICLAIAFRLFVMRKAPTKS